MREINDSCLCEVNTNRANTHKCELLRANTQFASASNRTTRP